MFDDDNENKEAQRIIDDIVSPGDQPLIDLVTANTDAIGIAKDIFSDRNSKDTTTAFCLGIIATVISRVSNIDVRPAKLIAFLAQEAEAMDE